MWPALPHLYALSLRACWVGCQGTAPHASPPGWLQARNGSLFPASTFTLYSTYLAYSALVAEPHSYECNSLGHRLNAASASTLATGMALALLSVVYSALRAGSNTALFNLGVSLGVADSEDAEGDQPLLDAGERGDASTSAGLDAQPEAQPPMARTRGEPCAAMPALPGFRGVQARAAPACSA